MRLLAVGDHVKLYLADRPEPVDALINRFTNDDKRSVEVLYLAEDPQSLRFCLAPFRSRAEYSIPEPPFWTDPHEDERKE
jgi:hypothetical protein